MAIQVDVALGPLTVVGAYVRIEQFTCNRFEEGMTCLARCYQSDPGFPPADTAFRDVTFNVPFDQTQGDPYAQAYVGAKALPEFSGAIDC